NQQDTPPSSNPHTPQITITLMLLLVAVLIAMMGFALVRHWKVQKGKNTVASPHHLHCRR
ncbi:hypothetical protein, partial [Candidatus Erwinia dacicola]